MKTCQRPGGCENPIRPPRTRYCSAACAHEGDKAKQRHQNYATYIPRGDRKRVLNETQVRDIRTNATDSYPTMAKRYGVSAQTIYEVMNYRTWRHIK